MPLALHGKTYTVPFALLAWQSESPKDCLCCSQRWWSSTWFPLTCPWHPASSPCALCHLWHFLFCCVLQLAVSLDVLSSPSWLISCTLISVCIKKENKNDPLWKQKLLCLLHSPKNCQFQIQSINLWEVKGGTIYHKLEQRFCLPIFSDVWILI